MSDLISRENGEWKWDDSMSFCEHFNCSICGYRFDDAIAIMKPELLPNYCPNCGARMLRGEEDGKIH